MDAKPSHKRMKGTGSTTNKQCKVWCLSAAQGIQDVASTMSEIVGTLNGMIKPEPSQTSASVAFPSNKCSEAIKAIQQDKFFSKEDFCDIMGILMLNPEVGSVYLDIDHPDAHTCYLQKQLEHYRNVM